MPKTYDYVDEWGGNHTIAFTRTSYAYGDGIAIEAACLVEEDDDEEPWWEPYAGVTVNLPVYPTGDGHRAFLDTNDSGHLVRWMSEQGLVELTGITVPCGFCVYPEGRFTTAFLDGCAAGDDEL